MIVDLLYAIEIVNIVCYRNDSDTLESVGMENDCVVHVLIGGRREEERREERGGRGNERVEEVRERREEGEERRDDLEGRVAYHMDYIREVCHFFIVFNFKIQYKVK